MKHFTIENETNNITIHASAKEADAIPDSQRFSNEAALAKLATGWPAARLVDIWNSLPGATPVKKFKDRATAASRIWKAIQTLGQTEPAAEPEMTRPEAEVPATSDAAPATTATPQTPDVAPEAATVNTKSPRFNKTSKPATAANGPREGSKTSQVIEMLKRDGGVTLEEIMTAMGWLKHTTRAMLSAGGSLTKKHRLAIVSEKIDGKRIYSIKG